jgi:hypothetical protein
VWRAIATLLLLGSLGSFSTAQIRDRTRKQPDQQNPATQTPSKPKQRGPRAIAVVEFLPGGGTRLVPVALWIDDRFYDASLYGANPEPMALQPQTVYEATDYGEPTGLFTVTQPQEVKGSWIGTGQWRAEKPLEKKIAQQAAKQPKPVEVSNPADDRPTLHRAAGSGSSDSDSSKGASGTNSTASASKPSSPEPPDRPTLKKPTPDTPAQPAASSAQKPSLGGVSGSQNAVSTASASTAGQEENDPNRPILRRGKPAASDSATDQTKQTAAAQLAATKPSLQAPSAGATVRAVRRSYPAVSDATPHETRSLLYVMNSSERAGKSEELEKMAMGEIRNFVAQRKLPALPKTAGITDSDLRAFDLDYSNSPTLVFTGKVAVLTAKAFAGGEFDYFVTLVAREDINGAPIKIFTSVTDSNHLDAYPRLEIIDAVDADANGRGDLLFRQYSDTGINYSLYRVHPYDMQKIFEGGSGV